MSVVDLAVAGEDAPLSASAYTANNFLGKPITVTIDHSRVFPEGPELTLHLVDDMTRIAQRWVDKGGHFVHFTGDVDETLLELASLGIT